MFLPLENLTVRRKKHQFIPLAPWLIFDHGLQEKWMLQPALQPHLQVRVRQAVKNIAIYMRELSDKRHNTDIRKGHIIPQQEWVCNPPEN